MFHLPVYLQVNNKVTRANAQATTATESMAEITARIQTIYACLQTQNQRSQATMVVVASLEQRAMEGETVCKIQ